MIINLMSSYYRNIGRLILADQKCATPFVQQVLKSQQPFMDGSKVILPISNEAVIPNLQQQYLPMVEKNLSIFWFCQISD